MHRRTLFAAGPAAAGLAGMALGGLAGSRPTASMAHSRIPDIEVWTHEGRKARFYADLVKGRMVTLNFMFVGCGETCPLITANLRAVQDLLGDRVGRDVFMYSITLMPELDTPEMLRDYAELYEIKPGWQFLTGKPADIEHLRRRLGFASADPELDKINDQHTGMLRYGDEALDRWGGVAALSRPEWIVKAITTSLLEPAALAADPARAPA